MKKFITIVLLLLSIHSSMNASVIYEDKNLHLYFKLDTVAKTASLGTGLDLTTSNALAVPPLNDSWWQNQVNYWEHLIIPETISYKGNNYTVNSIEPSAFYEETRVKTIVLPETIETIGNSAFYFCVNLESVNFPKSLKTIKANAFVLCSKLKNITLPNGLEKIESMAFFDCKNIRKINIPGTCTKIGNDAFGWCESITEIIIEDSEKTLNCGYGYGLSHHYQGSDTPKKRGLFADTDLSHVYIGRNLSYGKTSDRYLSPFLTISNYCSNTSGYQGYDGLTMDSVTWGSNVTEIANELFRNCHMEYDITMPPNLKSIGDKAFENSLNYQLSVTFPSSLESIGSNAFKCQNLSQGFVFITCNAINPPQISKDSFNKEATIFVPKGSKKLYCEDTNWGNKRIISGEEELITLDLKIPGILSVLLLERDMVETDVYRLKISGKMNDEDWETFEKMVNLYECDMSELNVTTLPQIKNDIAFLKLPNTLTQMITGQFTSAYINGTIRIPKACTSVSRLPFRSNLIDTLIIEGTTTLADEAFYITRNLKEVQILGEGCIIGTKAFASNNSMLKKVVLGKGTTVKEEAFYRCEALSEVILQDGVKEICINAFYKCPNIEEITIEGSIEIIQDDPGWVNLKVVHTKNISNWCKTKYTSSSTPFKYAKSLMLNGEEVSDLTIDETVEYIGDYCFYGLSSIKSVTLSNTTKSIGQYAFYNCKALKSINLSNELTTIESNAFENCESLEEITLPKTLETIGKFAFQNCIQIKKLTIHEKITILPQNVFSNCVGLNEIILHDGLKYISQEAFYGCSNIYKLNLPETLVSIGESAFNGCSNIEEIILPKNLTQISDKAFWGCKSIVKIIAPWQYPFVVKPTIFGGVSQDCILYIPMTTTILQYENKGWYVPNMKRYGNVNIDVSSGGYINYNNTIISDTVQQCMFIADESLSLTITADEGYELSSITQDQTDITSTIVDGVIQIENLKNEANISVVFSKINKLLGDINDDEKVNIADVILIVNYILGKSDIIETSIADANQDGILNIIDLVAIINNILCIEDNLSQARILEKNQVGKLSVEDITINHEITQDICINLSNETPYTAFQLDIILPIGLNLENCVLSSRIMEHNLQWQKQADGSTRIIGYSIGNKPIVGIDGTIFTLSVSADSEFTEGELVISKAIFCNNQLITHHLETVTAKLSNPSYVENIENITRIYVNNNMIVIETPTTQIARISTLDGIVKSVNLQPGRNEIPIQKGMYIVSVDKEIKKVFLN